MIVQGDCLDVMATLEPGSVDLVLCDPPYGLTSCKWDSVIPLEPMWAAIERVAKPNAAIVLCCAQPYTSALVVSRPKWFKYTWTWRKNSSTGFLNAKKQPLRCIEDLAVFYRKQPTYNPQMTSGKKYTVTPSKLTGSCYGTYNKDVTRRSGEQRYPQNILEFMSIIKNDFKSKKSSRLHPTQKPVALMEYMIKTYTNPGDTVLDFAMGSGTTLVAAQNLGRKAIGIELEEKYCEVARQRLQTQKPIDNTPSVIVQKKQIELFEGNS